MILDWIRRKFGPRVPTPLPAAAATTMPALVRFDAGMVQVVEDLLRLGVTAMVVRTDEHGESAMLIGPPVTPAALKALCTWAATILDRMPGPEMH